MKQSTFNLIIMIGFLAVITVACNFNFQRLEPTQVDYTLDEECDRNTVSYLSNEELPVLQYNLDQPSNYRLTVIEEGFYLFHNEFVELININLEINIGHGTQISVTQYKEDFINNRPNALVKFQRIDEVEDDSDVEVRLVHQELSDDVIAAAFMISDRKNNCEDSLDVSISRDTLLLRNVFMVR